MQSCFGFQKDFSPKLSIAQSVVFIFESVHVVWMELIGADLWISVTFPIYDAAKFAPKGLATQPIFKVVSL